MILEAGAPIEDIYFPLTGMISMLVVNSDGRPVETSTVGREGALGLQAALGKRRSFTRATAQIGGQFSTIRAARLNRIVHGNGSVRDLIARYTELLWAESQQNAACNAVHDCTARLCRWLLQSADHINSPTLPLTQEFLAQMLSVRRTTVTLLARALQARGMIRYTRGHITIVDRNALEASSCHCYHVIRHEKLASALGVEL